MKEFKYYVAYFSRQHEHHVTVLVATDSLNTARNLQHIYNTEYKWSNVFVTEPSHLEADGYEIRFLGDQSTHNILNRRSSL